MLSGRGRWCQIRSCDWGSLGPGGKSILDRERERPCGVREQVRKKVSVRWDQRVISGWLGLSGEGRGAGLRLSQCASTSECTVAGTVGPAWFSQPIVVIVTFEKDQLHPSGQRRLLEGKCWQTMGWGFGSLALQ